MTIKVQEDSGPVLYFKPVEPVLQHRPDANQTAYKEAIVAEIHPNRFLLKPSGVGSHSQRRKSRAKKSLAKRHSRAHRWLLVRSLR